MLLNIVACSSVIAQALPANLVCQSIVSRTPSLLKIIKQIRNKEVVLQSHQIITFNMVPSLPRILGQCFHNEICITDAMQKPYLYASHMHKLRGTH